MHSQDPANGASPLAVVAEAVVNNEVLACCMLPKSDVKVQVLGKMQRAMFRDLVALS